MVEIPYCDWITIVLVDGASANPRDVALIPDDAES